MEFGRGKRVKRVTVCCSGRHNCCSPGVHQPASGDKKKFQGFASRNPTLESCTDSYDDKYEWTVCEKCGRTDNEQEMLLCDGCDKGFHMFCLCPVLVTLPLGYCFCPLCSPAALVCGMHLPYLQSFVLFRKLEAPPHEFDSISYSQIHDQANKFDSTVPRWNNTQQMNSSFMCFSGQHR